MAQVNYIKELESFMLWAAANDLSPRERLLWQALFHLFNLRASGDVWPEGYVEIRMHELEEQTSLKRNSINRAREDLCRRGLIGCREGDRNMRAASYRLHYISVYGAPEAEKSEALPAVEPAGMVQNEHSKQGANCTKVQKTEGMVQNAPRQNTPVRTIDSVNVSPKPEEEDDIIINNQQRARENRSDCPERGEAMAKLRLRWEGAFGRCPTPEQLNAILDEGAGKDVGLLCEAVTRAARAGARDPVRYVAALISDWREVNDAEELDRFMDALRSPNPDISQRARERLAAYRREKEMARRRGGGFVSLLKNKLKAGV